MIVRCISNTLGNHGHCLSTCGACRAGRTSGIMPSIKSWATWRNSEWDISGLSYRAAGHLYPGEIIPEAYLHGLLWLTPFACLLALFLTCTMSSSWKSFKLCLFVYFSTDSPDSVLTVIRTPKMVLRRWLLIEKLMRIWLFDSLGITCPNLAYHKFLQKLRKETILSSSLWYVRILLGLLVRIFSMSVLLYNKFSLETPFLLLTALTWLLISAQAVPLPVISFLISLSRPSPTKSYPYFFRM